MGTLRPLIVTPQVHDIALYVAKYGSNPQGVSVKSMVSRSIVHSKMYDMMVGDRNN